MQPKQKLFISFWSITITIGVLTLIFWVREHSIMKLDALTETPAERSNEVYQRGSQVMPFEQNQTKHTFFPNSNGGTQTVTVNDSANFQQIKLIRLHLKEEAQKFARGDFSDPATIHGAEMPGLKTLQGQGEKLNVQYKQLPDGASLIYSSDDEEIITALHQWFVAQNQDHNGHRGMKH